MKRLLFAVLVAAGMSTLVFGQQSDRRSPGDQGYASLTLTCTNANTTCDSANTPVFGQLNDVIGPATLEVNTKGYGLATIAVSGTYAGSTLNFDFSDDGGIRWFSEICTRTDANIQEPSEAVATNATLAWECSVGSATRFRVRQSALGSGAPQVSVTLTSGIIEPAPTVAVIGAAANNALPVGAPTQNGWISTATGANPTAATAGNMITAFADVTGNLFVRTGGPNQIVCYARGVAAALTDFTQIAGGAGCGSQTGAGLKLYITDITVASTTATAGSFRLSYGTGAACATTNNALFPANASDLWFYPGNAANPLQISFNQPLPTTAAQRLCVFGTATNTANISVNAFIAP